MVCVIGSVKSNRLRLLGGKIAPLRFRNRKKTALTFLK